jgi:hypothetical protein
MRSKLSFIILSLFICSTVVSIGCFYNQELYAQEPMEDVVYFTDGIIARGTIIHISRNKIRIKQSDGIIIERSIMFLYRFSSKRHFREIYERAVEYGDREFWNRHKDW